MSSISGVLGLVGTLFGILALIAGVAVYLRGAYTKARIDTLNDEILEEKRRSAQWRADLGEALARVDVLDAKVAALNELVTQRAQLDLMRIELVEMRRQVERSGELLALLVDRKARTG